MRCPYCKRLLSVSFIDDVGAGRVYRCSTAGVPVFRTKRNGQEVQVAMTADHSDYYFIKQNRELVRVRVVALGTDTRKSLIPPYANETFHTFTVAVMNEVELRAEVEVRERALGDGLVFAKESKPSA